MPSDLVEQKHRFFFPPLIEKALAVTAPPNFILFSGGPGGPKLRTEKKSLYTKKYFFVTYGNQRAGFPPELWIWYHPRAAFFCLRAKAGFLHFLTLLAPGSPDFFSWQKQHINPSRKSPKTGKSSLKKKKKHHNQQRRPGNIKKKIPLMRLIGYSRKNPGDPMWPS